MRSFWKRIAWIGGLALLSGLSGCISSQVQQAAIATFVAQTVEAARLLPSATLPPSPSPQPPSTLSPSLTPSSVPATATTAAGPWLGCLQAELIGEDPIDQALFTPSGPLKSGATFTKHWYIRNTGSCTWDTSYRVRFVDGDLLGGAYVYHLPAVVPPQGTLDLAILLQAPTSPGTYKGRWILEAPNGIQFGVGPQRIPFWVEIVVSDANKPAYAVTSIRFRVERDTSRCPANVVNTVYAEITVNGPVMVTYQWFQSDDNESGRLTLTFDVAGVKTISRRWINQPTPSANPRWMQLVIHEPNHQAWDKIYLDFTCP
jgi:hypothetical protein